tara:strand:+ start:364 stop:546 length:183 start_codon:yes stop_codon:yes gene_type:complete
MPCTVLIQREIFLETWKNHISVKLSHSPQACDHEILMNFTANNTFAEKGNYSEECFRQNV